MDSGFFSVRFYTFRLMTTTRPIFSPCVRRPYFNIKSIKLYLYAKVNLSYISSMAFMEVHNFDCLAIYVWSNTGVENCMLHFYVDLLQLMKYNDYNWPTVTLPYKHILMHSQKLNV